MTGDTDATSRNHKVFNYEADEKNVLLFQYYLGFDMTLFDTIADGNCGIDVLTMNLGWERNKESHQLVRTKLAEFAYRLLGNRAFIALMSQVGEIKNRSGFP